jgi:hypothetical protein
MGSLILRAQFFTLSKDLQSVRGYWHTVVEGLRVAVVVFAELRLIFFLRLPYAQ